MAAPGPARDRLDVRVRWLAPAEGGRATPVFLAGNGGAFYRPHLRVGPAGEYLGVEFVAGDPPVAAPGTEGAATVEFLYAAYGVDYRPLAPGVTFDVLEGAQVVGRGTVLRRAAGDAGDRQRTAG